MNNLGFFVRLGRNEKALALAVVLLTAMSVRAETNSWIKPSDGLWQEETSWSLGILPDSSQSVVITNAGEKTVTINSDTAQNYPASLTVSNLTVSGTNTLLLDRAGTNSVLQIFRHLILEGGSLVNFGSGLIVGGTLAMSSGSQVIQSGGFVTNGGLLMYGAPSYFLTNGVFQSGGIEFISGNFYQNGGDALITEITLLDGRYTLDRGNLVTPNTTVRGSQGSARFIQQGGTNRTLSLSISDFGSSYSMNGGLLCTSNVLVSAGYSGATFGQDGGVHFITNTLTIKGSAYHYPWNGTPAEYSISNGFLSARSIVIDGRYGQSFLTLADSTTSISESLQFIGPSGILSELRLSGGVLTCSNVVNAEGAVDIFQSGGAFVVTNLFSFGGFYPGAYYGYGARYAKYDFNGGTLTASNIELAAEMVIGSSTQTGRITNPGYFKMSGTLTSGDATERLGRFILASNSVIDLGDGAAKLSFANSSAEAWDSTARLFVTNWDGFSGGDKLRFGNDASALTAQQLNQIRFVNPAGFPSGEFLAQILDTGEVVPKASPALSFGQSGTNFVLSWSSDFTLQTATNVTGPYEDLIGARPPYTNDVTESSQRFFRLRH